MELLPNQLQHISNILSPIKKTQAFRERVLAQHIKYIELHPKSKNDGFVPSETTKALDQYIHGGIHERFG